METIGIESLENSNYTQNTSKNYEITNNVITLANRWEHFLARWGYKRNGHRITPGLYALGNPTSDAHVFVTANYTLSFDSLRSALAGIDSYILVLDTKGVNVWCAAGKGTFGTDELVNRIEATGLHNVVKHRVLIIPQLGATGVSAHEVKKRSGFKVEYGPVRAGDLPEYLMTHKATPEMRRVRFPFIDRMILIPVELVHIIIPMLIVARLLLPITGSFMASMAVITAILTGVVLFPILLPWIPTPNFSTKGFILGGFMALIFAMAKFTGNIDGALWQRLGWSLTYLLSMPPITAFLALNFTGATTFTSKSGVKREMFTYIPFMAWMFGGGILLTITFTLIIILQGGLQ